MFFTDNKTFYPTPLYLAQRMKSKLQNRYPKRVLDGQAGKGDLIEGMFLSDFKHHQPDFFCIELDPTLQATLRGSNYKVIDSDFLNFCAPDKFDLIIGNPPFDTGDKHLLKAIEVMYCGEIVYLLNAETIRNPCTNTRKMLCQKLDELGASIEFISHAFSTAERKTDVEVALIHIVIKRDIENDLFNDCDDEAIVFDESIKDKHEVSTGRTVEELVASYNELISLGTESIISFYRNFPKIGSYLQLNNDGGSQSCSFMSSDTRKERMNKNINTLLIDARVNYWWKVLNIKEVSSRLTSERQREFEQALTEQSQMDFTEHNIRTFVINVIDSYEGTLTTAVVALFDKMTIRHHFHGQLYEKNIHLFNGWKTNNAFKVGKRVIIPCLDSFSDSAFFCSYSKIFKLGYSVKGKLDDIDKVMNYFDGMNDYISLSEAIKKAFAQGENKGSSTYFDFICYKKGTIHLIFRNIDVLRRFNICASRSKGWLPQDYGKKAYGQLSVEFQEVVESFEGKKSYTKNVGQPVFAQKTTSTYGIRRTL